MNKKISSEEIRFPNGKSSHRIIKRNINMNNPLACTNTQINNILPASDLVTFDKLGTNGRLGNQLFQIAVTIATAKKNNVNAIFPKWFCGYTNKDFSLFFENQIKQEFGINAPNIHQEGSFTYSPIQYNKGLCLRGYYQSEKYFEDFKDDIKFYFKPKKSIIDRLEKKYKKILNGNTCSIHIRRGDYVDNSFHYVCDLNYYNRAIDRIKEMSKINRFLIFSDDIEWCKLNFIGEEFNFIEGNRDIEDLFLMTLCKNHIISNSSFSWWGSWLCENNDKIIIAPNRWFTEKNSTDYKDVYTNNMTRI